MTRRQRTRRNGPELGKQAAAIARRMGAVLGPLQLIGQGEVRAVAEGGRLVRAMMLRVRQGEEFPDAAARHAMHSEHVGAVTGLPVRIVGGEPVCVRLDEHFPLGTLRGRLESGPLRIGESITVLVAVFDVLESAHRAGFGGVAPSAERIAFRADGCPVVTEFDDVGPLTRESAEGDTEAFLGLVRELSAASTGAGADLFPRIEAAVASGGGRLREELLLVAPPVAVQFGGRAATMSSQPESGSRRDTLRPRRGGPQRALRSRGVASWSAPVVLERSRDQERRWAALLDGDPLRDARSAFARMFVRRPRAVVLVGGPVLVGLVVLALLSTSRAADEPTPGPDASVGAASSTEREETSASDARGASGEGDATSAAEDCVDPDVFDLTGERAPDPMCPGADEPTGAGLRADDPAEAALALLAQREGGKRSGATAEVTQRWGEAVLVRVEEGPDSEPASLLLVRGEAGWRIRAVYS